MPSRSGSTRENIISLIPALTLLSTLGYKYLTPSEADALRDHKRSGVVLTQVLREQLAKLNRFEFKGNHYPFSEANLDLATRELAGLPFESLMSSSMKVYDLLTLGRSMQETIEGYVRSYQLKFIDWQNPENNVYHVSDEFVIERVGSTRTRRPDIVLFVNGIPLVVIECKRPEVGATEGVSQHLRNQKPEEIPHLYPFAQILLSVSQNEALYGATGAAKEYWGFWREEDQDAEDQSLQYYAGAFLVSEAEKHLMSWRSREDQLQMQAIWDARRQYGRREITAQDRLIYSLLRPARLLEIIYGYTLFDNKIKKITRYQQYFAIKETLKRVTRILPDGTREGGVIWHTTGSGKSLTMVMLAKALALEPSIRDPRVILVTDRVDLDDQIYRTFKACQKEVKKADSGRHLLQLLLNNEAQIITTIIDKFDTARTLAQNQTYDSADVFVLIDESHRSQYGSNHEKMKLLLPNACYIGFTGTPLLKKDKSTSQKFGGFIHKYTMNQAVQDGAVVPLRYEGRMSDLRADQQQLDRWFDRITTGLTDDQKADLKKKFHREGELLKANDRIMEIAYDIGQHFNSTFRDTQMKGQFAVSSKEMAIRYKQAFEAFRQVKVEVVISPPDTREGHESTDEMSTPLVQQFWNAMMHNYGDADNYQKSVIEAFKNSDEPEILIVVDKLLTGFDAPRNAVLYLDKKLKEHNILQAIARVNRVFESKDYGLVIDYRGIFGDLTDAMDMYAALEQEGFDLEDIEGTMVDVWEDIQKLPEVHASVWAVFNGVQNKSDHEAMQRHLEPENIRDEFYAALRSYARVMQLAFANGRFIDNTPLAEQRRYKDDLKFFLNLRVVVKQRYGEAVDYSRYEVQIRNLVQKHVGADQVKVIMEPVDITSTVKFEAEIDSIQGEAAKADAIASRIRRTITVNMDEDPTFYRQLSQIIQDVIDEHRAKRLSDLEYLRRIREVLEKAQNKVRDDLPVSLVQRSAAQAYYGIIKETLKDLPITNDQSAEVALQLDDIILRHQVIDWYAKEDVQKAMKNDMEDFLVGFKKRSNVPISFTLMDDIMDRVIQVARNRA
ncbi:type I restriction endonuclease subunit R [Deinococcus roseus]|uniref:Type I restriction enzyme endonuclease subunit n=1 Tax=Deinococcus roseus TaxID=392414 RepID=A0ABQ2CXN7_9DEIO|nr:type I restriction endonuclease subunit R [Deinococcus roseus]GGJ27292.1 DEAD/DEAH box helicase [Deinococcus roseus]